MSKWLVGSSKSSMCGICHESQANTTRHFWCIGDQGEVDPGVGHQVGLEL